VRALVVSLYPFKELSPDRHKSRGGERVLLTSLVSPTEILKNHQTHLIHPLSTPYNTKEYAHESRVIFTFFKKSLAPQAREPVKYVEKT